MASTSKIASKYLKELENQVITERTENEKEEQELLIKGDQEGKEHYTHGHVFRREKESKMDTACFKVAS